MDRPRIDIHEGIVMFLRWVAALVFVGGLAVGLGAGMTATLL